jgi:uncharacterized membrane protein YkgB
MLVLGALLAWRDVRAVAWAAGAVGALLVFAGLAVPTRLGPVERAWYALASAISKVTTPIVMGVLHFLILTPAGLVARLFGFSPLRRPRAPASAWVRRSPNERRGDLDRQF